jgi:DNA modification methylase
LDPPFNSGRNYSFAGGIAFRDVWESSQEYSAAMRLRLWQLHQKLSPIGSIFLHCDSSSNYHLRILLDEVFGPLNFVNEIVWYYYNKMQGNIHHFPGNHDTIFWYAKSRDFHFTTQKEQRDVPVRQLKRVWDKGKLVNAKDGKGHCIYVETSERRVDDVWRLPMLQPASQEYTGYPTQKPEALLARIVAAASSAGDLVLDPYCGTGTLLAVARKLGRAAIGIDSSTAAIAIAENRLSVRSIPCGAKNTS